MQTEIIYFSEEKMIPEALETDGKAQWERVFKNFEGYNRNEFRVK